MPAPRVIRNVIDRSSYVPANAGVTGAMVLEAVRGPVGKATLVTSQRDFLDRFTPTGEMTRDLPVGYLSALAYLEKSNALYVQRVIGTGALYAQGGGASGTAVDPSVIDPNDMDSPAAQALVVDNPLTVQSRSSVEYETEGDVDPANLFTRKVSVFARDPGAWANGWSVDLVVTPLTARYEGTPAYTLSVKRPNGTVAETFLVAFDPAKTDTFGNTIYFAEVVKNSKVILLAAAPEEANVSGAIPSTALQTSVLADGAEPTTSMTSGDAVAALNGFDGLDVRLYFSAGITDVAYQKALAAKCEEESESFAFLSVPYDVEKTGDTTQIIDWVNTTLNLNSVQASAPYCGWLEVSQKGGGTRWCPPDAFVAANFSRIMARDVWWRIGAGHENGNLVSPIRVLNKWSDGSLDVLADGGVNLISSFSGEGILVWTQKTSTKFPSALDRISTSLLLMFVTISAKRFLRKFLHRWNTQETADEIESSFIQFGDRLKADSGIYDYRVEVIREQFDIDNYQLQVNFYVAPVRGIETIILNEVVTSAARLDSF